MTTEKRMMEIAMVIITRQKSAAKASFCWRRICTLHRRRIGIERTAELVRQRVIASSG